METAREMILIRKNAVLVKLTDLGGNWQVAACVAGKLDLTSFVTDTSDKNGNIYCCKDK